MKIIGIDASPAATGLAFSDGSMYTLKNNLPKYNPVHLTGPRLLFIHRRVNELLDAQHPDVAVLEGYNYGLKKFGRVFEIGEAAGVIKLALELRGIPLIGVAPGARAKYGSGSGKSNKAAVIAAWSRLTGLEFTDDNQCDAHILLNIGHALVDSPLVSVPTLNRAALTEIREGQRVLIDQLRATLGAPRGFATVSAVGVATVQQHIDTQYERPWRKERLS